MSAASWASPKRPSAPQDTGFNKVWRGKDWYLLWIGVFHTYAAWQEIILNAVVLILLVVVNHVFEAAPLHEGHPLCQPASLLQLLAALPRAPCNMPARTSGPAPPYRCWIACLVSYSELFPQWFALPSTGEAHSGYVNVWKFGKKRIYFGLQKTSILLLITLCRHWFIKQFFGTNNVWYQEIASSFPDFLFSIILYSFNLANFIIIFI